MVATNRSPESRRFQPGLPDMSKPSSQHRDGPFWKGASEVDQDGVATGRAHPEGSPPAMLPAVVLWFCFILDLICMISGILGLCTAPSQAPSSIYTAWLGVAYIPALRVTAVACFAMGVILARKGWTQP